MSEEGNKRERWRPEPSFKGKVKRILDAVSETERGRSLVAKVDIDAHALHEDLQGAGRRYDIAVGASMLGTKKQTDDLGALVKSAKNTKRLINEDSRLRNDRKRAVISILDDLAAEAEALLRPVPLDEARFVEALRASFNDLSSFDYLIGVELQPIFEKHFKSKAGLGRSVAGEPNSPFIRFAEAVLCELQITNKGTPYRRKSIFSAVQKSRRLKK